MSNEELIAILEDLALLDCHPESTLYDHPCSVAVRRIETLEDNIKHLVDVMAVSRYSTLSKRTQLLIKQYGVIQV